MPQPAAKEGDKVIATDSHLVVPEGGGSPVPTPLPFDGALDASLSPDVLVERRAVAVVGSVAHQSPGHAVAPKTFVRPPSNRGTVLVGSSTVLANNKEVARHGDAVETCGDPTDQPVGVVVASGTVLVG